MKAVGDPAQIESLAGIVCVRLDPFATQAVEKAAELGVPVWLSMRTAAPPRSPLAEQTGVDIVANICPMMYTNARSYPLDPPRHREGVRAVLGGGAWGDAWQVGGREHDIVHPYIEPASDRTD